MKISVNENCDYFWKWEGLIIPPAGDIQMTEIIKWLTATVGNRSKYGKWCLYTDNLILFREHEDAVMFQLAWSTPE